MLRSTCGSSGRSALTGFSGSTANRLLNLSMNPFFRNWLASSIVLIPWILNSTGSRLCNVSQSLSTRPFAGADLAKITFMPSSSMAIPNWVRLTCWPFNCCSMDSSFRFGDLKMVWQSLYILKGKPSRTIICSAISKYPFKHSVFSKWRAYTLPVASSIEPWSQVTESPNQVCGDASIWTSKPSCSFLLRR